MNLSTTKLLTLSYRSRLCSDQAQVKLIANGVSEQLPFQAAGPSIEAMFLEELLEERFGGLHLNPLGCLSF